MVRQRAVNPWGNQLQVRVLSSEPFQCLLGRTVMQQTLNLCDVGSTPSAGTIFLLLLLVQIQPGLKGNAKPGKRCNWFQQ